MTPCFLSTEESTQRKNVIINRGYLLIRTRDWKECNNSLGHVSQKRKTRKNEDVTPRSWRQSESWPQDEFLQFIDIPGNVAKTNVAITFCTEGTTPTCWPHSEIRWWLIFVFLVIIKVCKIGQQGHGVTLRSIHKLISKGKSCHRVRQQDSWLIFVTDVPLKRPPSRQRGVFCANFANFRPPQPCCVNTAAGKKISKAVSCMNEKSTLGQSLVVNQTA